MTIKNKELPMELRLINDPRYTIEHINELQKYGNKCFEAKISESDLDNQLIKIRDNIADRRAPESAKVYEIHSPDFGYCGDITFMNGEDSYTELSIIIFERAAGKGVARTALLEAISLLANQGVRKLEALVYIHNPFNSVMNNLLIGAGFYKHENLESTTLYRFDLG
jgi:RimJ/RimL family protein N-acetyltransferase